MQADPQTTDAVIAQGYDPTVIETLVAWGATNDDLHMLLQLDPQDRTAGLVVLAQRLENSAVPDFYAHQAAARSQSSWPSWWWLAALFAGGYLLLRR